MSELRDIEAIMARVAYEAGPIGNYPHSLFSVGTMTTHDEREVIGIHATIGKAKFEFWLNPDEARMLGKHLLFCADLLDKH